MQAAVLDLSFNVGIGAVLSFPGLRKAVAKGEPDQILIETLNTTMVDNKNVLGVAARRARMFAVANKNPELTIDKVEMLENGIINYIHDGAVLVSVKHPPHPKSKPGVKLAPDFR